MSIPTKITTEERNRIENSGQFETIEKIADVNTMYALIRGKARFPTCPCEAYSNGIGTPVLLSLGFQRNSADWRDDYIWVEYYRESVNRLRAEGLIEFYKYEHPGMMEAHMLPTTKGYEWFERKVPGKYKEILDEIREKGLFPPREA